MTVVSSSLDPDGTTSGSSSPAQSIVAPTMIEIDFSDKIDPTTLTASDLVLSGTGLSVTNPAHATSLAWVDSHTVEFLLDGAFNTTGTVNVKIAAGTIKDTAGVGIDAYSETFRLGANSTPVAAAGVASTVALPIQPVAVAGPVAVHYGKVARGHSAKAHAAATALAHKKEAAVAKARAAAHAKAAAVGGEPPPPVRGSGRFTEEFGGFRRRGREHPAPRDRHPKSSHQPCLAPGRGVEGSPPADLPPSPPGRNRVGTNQRCHQPDQPEADQCCG